MMERALPTNLQALGLAGAAAVISLPVMIILYNWLLA
jgi:hypothetical protein